VPYEEQAAAVHGGGELLVEENQVLVPVPGREAALARSTHQALHRVDKVLSLGVGEGRAVPFATHAGVGADGLDAEGALGSIDLGRPGRDQDLVLGVLGRERVGGLEGRRRQGRSQVGTGAHGGAQGAGKDAGRRGKRYGNKRETHRY